MGDETVLITGGSGFIGFELAKTMADKGHPVVIFDLKPPRDLPSGGPLAFMRGDITNFPQVLDAVREVGPHGIVHLAAVLSEQSEASPWTSISVNALGTYHILEAARLFSAKKVLISSSMGVYVNDRKAVDVVTEETPQRPSLVYGVTKVFSELLALYYHKKFGLDTRGIRLPVLDWIQR